MGTEERKKRERKRRKNQILNAAIVLIEEQGFEDTTMDEIAGRAELSKGTLYLYYRDKATLYQAIKKQALHFLHDEFLAIIQKDRTGAELVKEMMLTFLNLAHENATFTKAMMLYEQINENQTDEDSIIEDCTHLEDELQMLITRSIQIGIQDGSIKSELNPKVQALQIGFHIRGILQFCIIDSKEKGLQILDENDLSLSELMEHFLCLQFSQSR